MMMKNSSWGIKNRHIRGKQHNSPITKTHISIDSNRNGKYMQALLSTRDSKPCLGWALCELQLGILFCQISRTQTIKESSESPHKISSEETRTSSPAEQAEKKVHFYRKKTFQINCRVNVKWQHDNAPHSGWGHLICIQLVAVHLHTSNRLSSLKLRHMPPLE